MYVKIELLKNIKKHKMQQIQYLLNYDKELIRKINQNKKESKRNIKYLKPEQQPSKTASNVAS